MGCTQPHWAHRQTGLVTHRPEAAGQPSQQHSHLWASTAARWGCTAGWWASTAGSSGCTAACSSRARGKETQRQQVQSK